jgi:hypothetical protein
LSCSFIWFWIFNSRNSFMFFIPTKNLCMSL